jgi:iron(III) transport system substrate-binding protein
MRGRRKVARGVITGSLLAAVALAAAAIPAGATVARSSSTTIILYNAQHEETTDALVKAFEQQTGIQVKTRNGDEGELEAQIEQEGSASPADVFYTENSPPLMALEEKGDLAKVDASTLAAVPSQYNSPKGDWVGVSARVSCLVYNTDDLKPGDVPTSVMDLADKKWKGKLALAPTETDFQPIVTSIELSKGKAAAAAWLRAVKANAAGHIYPDNETLVTDVNRGQAEIGIINHYYWYRLVGENGKASVHSAVAYFAPGDLGYLVDVSGGAVLKSSKHQAAAQKLLAFLVSAKGETVLAKGASYEYPLGSGVAPNPALPPFSQFDPAPLTIAQLGDGSAAIHLLQTVQLL